jgi:hypothetical protein
MNSSVRKYKLTDAGAASKIADEVEKEFVEIVKQVDGFGGYYLIDGGDGTLVTITVAESTDAVEASAAKAAEWVQGNETVSSLMEGAPEVTNGEVLVSVSA